MVVTVMGSTVQKKGGWHVGHIKFTELKLKENHHNAVEVNVPTLLLNTDESCVEV